MKINKILTSKIILIVMMTFTFMKSKGQNLEQHRWENRILLVKTSDINSKKYEEQLKEFGNSKEEMIDRKLLMYQISGNDFILTDFKSVQLKNSEKKTGKLTQKIFNEKENFEILLIGLDGSIKLQQNEILKKEELFKIIDSMQMRSSELKNNRK